MIVDVIGSMLGLVKPICMVRDVRSDEGPDQGVEEMVDKPHNQHVDRSFEHETSALIESCERHDIC